MKTFIDTSPFIYLIENNPQFAAKTRKFIMDAVINNEELITSVITIMEFGVIPQKKGRQDLILKFEDFLKIMNISIEEIDQEMARKAFQLKSHFFKISTAYAVLIKIDKWLNRLSPDTTTTTVGVVLKLGALDARAEKL